MPIVRNEGDVKAKSQFLDYEAGDGNSLILLSHLYTINFHFLESARKYVACREDECTFCQNGYEIGTEYNYMVDLNGQKGFMNIKGSVFFAIQKIVKAQKKDPRQISWTVIKTGEGKGTKYTTSKNDNLAKEDYDQILSEIDSNTQKLADVMEKTEENHNQNYIACFMLARPQVKKDKEPVAQSIETKKQQEEQVENPEPDPNEPEVKPSDIPF